MSTVGSRLAELIEDENLNNTSFGKKINTTPSAVGEMIKGSRNIGINTAYKIVKAVPGLNLNWLFFGLGP
ncbi:helix-turn-helix domain-containing protein [Flavobacterium sp. 3HN19-14]|uniref:helix-turn-helix domain-containing protein n=1 Tax=Flavobacterium sp. 3HN19-14 TaxID=3448133 RepID=UPI003EDFDA44